MSSRAICNACLSTDFDLIDGVLICSACGTQSQVPVEEQEFDDQGQTYGTRLRKIHVIGPQSTQQTIESEVQLADREAEQDVVTKLAQNYAKCLQIMLQAQAHALVQRMELPDDVSGLIRHLWLSYIPRTGFLDIDLDEMMESKAGLKRKARRQRRGGSDGYDGTMDDNPDDNDDDDGNEVDPVWGGDDKEDDGDQEESKRLLAGQALRNHRITNTFNRVLPPSTTLTICYLACLTLRQPVTSLDLIRWALQGHLPYQDMPNRCHAFVSSLPSNVRPPLKLLTILGAPTPPKLDKELTILAAQLKLPLPNVNGELLLLKCCKELRKPEGIFLVARELFIMNLIDTPIMNLAQAVFPGHVESAMTSTSPYICIAALAVLALKLGYGIGGATSAPRFPGLPPAPPSWLDWADSCLSSPACKPLNLPLSADEASQLRGSALLRYLDFCRSYAFPEEGLSGCPEELLDVRRALIQRLEEQKAQREKSKAKAASSRGTQRQMHSARFDDIAWEEHRQHQHQEEGDPQGEPSASSLDSSCMYIKFNRLAALPPDLVALVAVAAAYATVSPRRMLNTLNTLEVHLLRSDKAYVSKRAALHAATGGALFRIEGGDDGTNEADL